MVRRQLGGSYRVSGTPPGGHSPVIGHHDDPARRRAQCLDTPDSCGRRTACHRVEPKDEEQTGYVYGMPSFARGGEHRCLHVHAAPEHHPRSAAQQPTDLRIWIPRGTSHGRSERSPRCRPHTGQPIVHRSLPSPTRHPPTIPPHTDAPEFIAPSRYDQIASGMSDSVDHSGRKADQLGSATKPPIADATAVSDCSYLVDAATTNAPSTSAWMAALRSVTSRSVRTSPRA
jgi:hypothetical protein